MSTSMLFTPASVLGILAFQVVIGKVYYSRFSKAQRQCYRLGIACTVCAILVYYILLAMFII